MEDVGACPTTIDELVPDEVSSTQGACDASKNGLGSVQIPSQLSDSKLKDYIIEK
jgi:hypothetical protein